MVSKILSIGDRIELVKIANRMDNERPQRHYVSQLLELLDNDQAKIAMPIESSRVIPLNVGDKYLLCFYTEKGLYQCYGEIIDRNQENNVYILIVTFTSQLEKFQRRQYYRLEYITEVEYKVISPEENSQDNQITPSDQESEWYPAIITDISGGGARFNSIYLHEKNEKLIIKIALPTSKSNNVYELKSNVISSIPVANRSGFFENRVEFSEIELFEREAIIKFVFEEERKIRKREKGLI